MATGALDANGIWQYGEDDSNTTFSALINRLGSSTSTQIGALNALKRGKVLQVVSATKTDTAATTSSTYADITGLSVTVTPAATTSKVLVSVNVNLGASADQLGQVQLLRGTTAIYPLSYARFDNSAWMVGFSMMFLDSPATTSATTYKLQWKNGLGTTTTYLNRRGFDATINTYSSITVQEIGA